MLSSFKILSVWGAVNTTIAKWCNKKYFYTFLRLTNYKKHKRERITRIEYLLAGVNTLRIFMRFKLKHFPCGSTWMESANYHFLNIWKTLSWIIYFSTQILFFTSLTVWGKFVTMRGRMSWIMLRCDSWMMSSQREFSRAFRNVHVAKWDKSEIRRDNDSWQFFISVKWLQLSKH